MTRSVQTSALDHRDIREADRRVLSEAAAKLLRGTRAREDEAKKRRSIALELVEELKTPLVPGSEPHDLEAIAAHKPERPATERGERIRVRP